MFYKKRIELLESQVDSLIESRLELFRENFIILQRLSKLEETKREIKTLIDEYKDLLRKSKKLK